MCDTETKPANNVHHGRNIRRMRDLLGIKQEAIAKELDISQQSVSEMEQKVIIDDETLEKVAKVLNVPVNALKYMTDESTINYFNTFNHTVDNSAFGTSNNINYSFNPIEKINELHEENKSLYERMLKVEQERSTSLERIIIEHQKTIEKLLNK